MYLIIGQGAAGVSAAVRLRQLDKSTPVMMISQEPDYFYSRIDLPDIIAGKLEPDMAGLRDAEEFAGLGVECRMNSQAVSIDPPNHTVELCDGDKLVYRKLLLATGSHPVVPPIKGIGASNVFTLWNMQQARAIIQAADTAKSAVVIGAGLIGLKTALALKKRGLKVTVVERMPRIMPRQLDSAAAAIVADSMRAQGVSILTDAGVDEIVCDGDTIRGVCTHEGVIFADLVIVSVGVRANIDLAIKAGISAYKGIQTDRYLQTSASDIYAAGDAAEVTDALTGLPVVPAIWPEAVRQGQIAAANMAGRPTRYEPGTAMNSVEVAGVPMVSVGRMEDNDDDQVYLYHQDASYRKVIVHEGAVEGVLCLGDIRHAGVLGNLVLRKAAFDRPEELIRPGFSYASLAVI